MKKEETMFSDVTKNGKGDNYQSLKTRLFSLTWTDLSADSTLENILHRYLSEKLLKCFF